MEQDPKKTKMDLFEITSTGFPNFDNKNKSTTDLNMKGAMATAMLGALSPKIKLTIASIIIALIYFVGCGITWNIQLIISLFN